MEECLENLGSFAREGKDHRVTHVLCVGGLCMCHTAECPSYVASWEPHPEKEGLLVQGRCSNLPEASEPAAGPARKQACVPWPVYL